MAKRGRKSKDPEDRSNLTGYTIYLDDETHADLKKYASKEERSINKQMVYFIKEGIKNSKLPAQPACPIQAVI
jgi:hypothetical protein